MEQSVGLTKQEEPYQHTDSVMRNMQQGNFNPRMDENRILGLTHANQGTNENTINPELPKNNRGRPLRLAAIHARQFILEENAGTPKRRRDIAKNRVKLGIVQKSNSIFDGLEERLDILMKAIEENTRLRGDEKQEQRTKIQEELLAIMQKKSRQDLILSEETDGLTGNQDAHIQLLIQKALMSLPPLGFSPKQAITDIADTSQPSISSIQRDSQPSAAPLVIKQEIRKHQSHQAKPTSKAYKKAVKEQRHVRKRVRRQLEMSGVGHKFNALYMQDAMESLNLKQEIKHERLEGFLGTYGSTSAFVKGPASYLDNPTFKHGTTDNLTGVSGTGLAFRGAVGSSVQGSIIKQESMQEPENVFSSNLTTNRNIIAHRLSPIIKAEPVREMNTSFGAPNTNTSDQRMFSRSPPTSSRGKRDFKAEPNTDLYGLE
jgi:hypothetical protein